MEETNVSMGVPMLDLMETEWDSSETGTWALRFSICSQETKTTLATEDSRDNSLLQ